MNTKLVNKWLSMCASFVVLAMAGAYAGDEIETDQSPRSAAEAFLFLIDQDNYEESWEEASPLLKRMVDADEWAVHAGSYRLPLGDLDNREFKTVELHDSLEGMPDGQYAFVFFESLSIEGRKTFEMVGLKLDADSVWRVIGYQTD